MIGNNQPYEHNYTVTKRSSIHVIPIKIHSQKYWFTKKTLFAHFFHSTPRDIISALHNRCRHVGDTWQTRVSRNATAEGAARIIPCTRICTLKTEGCRHFFCFDSLFCQYFRGFSSWAMQRKCSQIIKLIRLAIEKKDYRSAIAREMSLILTKA